MTLTELYSGVVLNQNVAPTGFYNWRSNGAGWIYQTFYLPDNYRLGSNSDELRYPDLSGFQILVNIDISFAETASLDYTMDFYDGGWNNLAQGTVIGSHADGPEVWMDVIFPKSVPVTNLIANSVIRIGVATRTASATTFRELVRTIGPNEYAVNNETVEASLVPGVPYPTDAGGVSGLLILDDTRAYYSVQQGISSVGYVTPNPLTIRPAVSSRLAVSVQALSERGQAYQSDNVTPLVGTPSSINFRLLALTADDGVDFLGNEFRSCVVQAGAANADSTRSAVVGNLSHPYWLSGPQPSRFAVVSQYLDARPVPSEPVITHVNEIGNPSLEYDLPGGTPAWWVPLGTPTLHVRSSVVPNADPNYTSWADQGAQVLRMTYTFPTLSQGSIVGISSPTPLSVKGQPFVSLSFDYNLIASNGAALSARINWYDATSTLLSSTVGPLVTALGTGTLGFSAGVPANAVTCTCTLFAINNNVSAGAAFSAEIDGIQKTFTAAVQPYFDGDMVNSQWTGRHGSSSSVQYSDPEILDQPVVIDGIYLSPLTPNVAFNVYYSQDDAGTAEHMTEQDWEQKLWTRVPRAYVATQGMEYTFPAPIHAKYVKVEFTNLQAQSYTPGNFEAPIQYKKFPSWVAEFFIGQMQLPAFVASLVNVQYDALNFAYDYMLDDLGSRPDQPLPAPVGSAPDLTKYFQNQTTSGLDANTLAQIDLVMNRFAQPSGLITNPSLLGTAANTLAFELNAPVQEENLLTPVDYSTVSSLTREPVLIEQSMPVMYFFLTCRHAYKELSASLDHNRAYFAGVNDLALVRHDYTVPADTDLYIESGGDSHNTERFDFVVDEDQNWCPY